MRSKDTENPKIEEDVVAELNHKTDQKEDPTTEFRKKKKKPKNRIRSATSGAFDYIKKKKEKKPSKSIDEDPATASSTMLGDDKHCDITDDNGGN